jgi:uncharacterized protein YodC (DUF2158 family)
LAKFKIGDLVQLKSGGPTMIVKEEVYGGDLKCQWFSGKKLEEGDFHPDTLEHAKAEEKK